jgi:hypothetical protein
LIMRKSTGDPSGTPAINRRCRSRSARSNSIRLSSITTERTPRAVFRCLEGDAAGRGPLDGALNLQRLAGFVKIDPAEPEHLVTTHAGTGCHSDEQVRRQTAEAIHQRLDLILVERNAVIAVTACRNRENAVYRSR